MQENHSVYLVRIYWEIGMYRNNPVLNTISIAYIVKSEFLSVSFLPLQSYLLCISPHFSPGQVLFEGFWIKHASRLLCLSPMFSPICLTNLILSFNIRIYPLLLSFSKGKSSFIHLSSQPLNKGLLVTY